MKVLLLALSVLVSCFASEGDTARLPANSVPPTIPVENVASSKSLDVTIPALPLPSSANYQTATQTTISAPPAVNLTPAALSKVPWEPEVRQIVDTAAMIQAASKKHNVPFAFIKSIVAAESNFNPAAVSAKGAIGLMQLMPSTAQLFGADPAIPAQNIDAGTHYLRILMDKYHKYRDWMKRVIAAYNAGPGVVDRFRGVPPFPETRTYVARVLGYFNQFQRQRG